ncbi:hypothetical protein GKC30_13035 [Pseudodesulfovibrio sp. F-1]|uniref:Uncharacterized protein n=1 Tax=Pseudodesulfovibrio alkaliphilus TaxID=2661613 RepID=A0A7K1KRR2_9BACT|nr:hypothetical protein [Pseudodesulfovibrio alkaliphilus]MUM78561.1 hypothetical protein [Pseudodesulfovibrio alkaliphilus]
MSHSPQFHLTEIKSGWLEAYIVLGGARYDLSAHCALSEPLKDLFRCLCDVHGLDAPPDMAVDYHHLEFEWVGEGWLYYWSLAPGPGGRLEVRVEFKGKREVGGVEYPVWSICFDTDWAALAGQVFDQSASLLRQYGFAGYLDRWSRDFPAGQMMRLGRLLHGRSSQCEGLTGELAYLGGTA